MKPITNKIFLEHDTGMHPENAKRIENLGFAESDVPDGEEFLELFHTRHYIDRVKDLSSKGALLDPDTMTSQGSYNAAVHAVGATVKASETGGFAIVRPPGHHAHPDRSSGFCLFNNISIAVKKLVDEGKRVLIFDFDGHLGDGTMKFFYSSDKVMYWSLHQYPAFPGLGNVEEIGEGVGKGFTIPIPLPKDSGDDIFLDAIKRTLPIAKRFNPDIVAVSAGFDAHQHDPVLDLRISLNPFYEVGKMLKENFKDVFATLEGGYNVEILSKCIHNFLDGVNGKPQQFKEESTDSMIQVHDEYNLRMDLLMKNLGE